MPARSFALAITAFASLTWLLVLVRLWTGPSVALLPLVLFFLLAGPLVVLSFGWLRHVPDHS